MQDKVPLLLNHRPVYNINSSQSIHRRFTNVDTPVIIPQTKELPVDFHSDVSSALLLLYAGILDIA